LPLDSQGEIERKSANSALDGIMPISCPWVTRTQTTACRRRRIFSRNGTAAIAICESTFRSVTAAHRAAALSDRGLCKTPATTEPALVGNPSGPNMHLMQLGRNDSNRKPQTKKKPQYLRSPIAHGNSLLPLARKNPSIFMGPK